MRGKVQPEHRPRLPGFSGRVLAYLTRTSILSSVGACDRARSAQLVLGLDEGYHSAQAKLMRCTVKSLLRSYVRKR